METDVGDFILGVTTTLCLLLVFGMMGFGPDILEWLEGRETG